MAIIRPCPNHPVCPKINGFGFSDDPDSPVANLSSEAPDPVDFAWTKFLYNDPPINSPNNFWNNPYGTGTGTITCPPGTVQTSAGCQGYCELNPWSRGCAPVTREAETNANPGRQMFSNTEQVCVDFCDDGSQFVHSVEAGRVVATTQAQANAIALAQCQQEVSQQKICFGTSSLPGGCVDSQNYSQQIQASGGTPTITGNAYLWEISSGSLPPGLTLNPTNGFITGFPTTSGTYTFTVKITDGTPNSASREFTITIVEITSSTTLPSASAGWNYAGTTLVSNPPGGIWTVSGGNLPTGLSLSSGGSVTGTPDTTVITSTQTFSFTAQVIVAGSTCSKQFSIKVWKYMDSFVDSWTMLPSAPNHSTTQGPGMFRLEYITAGTPYLIAFQTPPDWLSTTGGVAGDCPDVLQSVLSPIGNIPGYSARGTHAAVGPACDAGTLALNPLLEFELVGSTLLTNSWGIVGIACGLPLNLASATGSGTGYKLRQIGQP